MVWDLSVNVKSLSLQASFFLPVMFHNPGITTGKKSLGLDWGFPFSVEKGVKVIWRWPCKSYFPLDWLCPMPSVALQSLWACVLACFVKLFHFFSPLRSRDLFSWPHFCNSLDVLTQMSAIADTLNFLNTSKNFLPSFLVTLERKNCWTLKKCRNSYKCIPFNLSDFLEVSKALRCWSVLWISSFHTCCAAVKMIFCTEDFQFSVQIHCNLTNMSWSCHGLTLPLARSNAVLPHPSQQLW